LILVGPFVLRKYDEIGLTWLTGLFCQLFSIFLSYFSVDGYDLQTSAFIDICLAAKSECLLLTKQKP
jgi:hypothetical protein